MEDNDEIDFVTSEHDRLVSAITKLDKTQHINEPTRNEPTSQTSEFNLIKRTNKLKLDNVVKVLEDTSYNIQIGKKLRKSQEAANILPKPLEKPQAERIKRETGYEATKKKVGRWDPVVARNRTVDYVSFPIKHFPSKLQPTGDFLSKLKLKSPLEKELEEIDPSPEVNEDNVEDEQQIYPMSYHEMIEQRQHLAKLRAQQSYKAAKAKRQSKIKSKKYHRILKKEKLKQQIKEFEELQSKDPEKALKMVEALEKARALERHTLRHKNTGKWAKSKLVRAKYDKEVRQELAEQLSVSRSLTHKTQNIDSTDDEADVLETIPDLNLAQDPMNPWMMKGSDKSNVDADFNFGYKKYLKDKKYKQKEDNDSGSEENAETKKVGTSNFSLELLKESILMLSNNKDDIDEKLTSKNEREQKKSNVENINGKIENIEAKSNRTYKTIATSNNWVVHDICNSLKQANQAEDIISAFDKFEHKVVQKVDEKLNNLRSKIKEKDTLSKKRQIKKKEHIEEDNINYLKLKNVNPKPIIDEELLETNRGIEQVKENEPTLLDLLTQENHLKENANVDIDPNRFITVQPKYLNTAISKGANGLDDLDDEEQVVPKVNIEEVFEEDDVVASFRQEKEEEINNDTSKQIDLTLPGWGNWGGKGVKAQKRKRNRFITKALPKVRRRDENKGDIIINEYKNPKLALHKVSNLPFPFTSVKDYEASIRAPLGNTFIPETAHKKLIKPNVITKAGAVIEPMDEDELLVKRNFTFKNDSVIKLLAKK